MFRSTLLLTACLCCVTFPAAARTDAKCLVSYEGERGWSRQRRADVEFYAAREVFPNDRDSPVWAKIWFNEDAPAMVALYGTSLISPKLYPSSLNKLFASGQIYTGEERDDPQRWKIQCVVNGEWVDPRYPEAFDPPTPVPPSRRYR